MDNIKDDPKSPSPETEGRYQIKKSKSLAKIPQDYPRKIEENT